jgi:predicted nucleic acid-binding protein
MVSNILVDTSVLVNVQKEIKKTSDLFVKYQDRILISRMTAYELIYGSRNKREKELNKKFIENIEVFEINEAISIQSYNILDKYGLATKFGIIDAVIAATAIVNKYPLWTLNKKHFRKIKRLKLFV